MPFRPAPHISEAIIRAAWMDGCRTGAVVVAVILILLYLWKRP